MAAPHTTGAVALLMQKFGAVTPAFCKTYLQNNAVVDGFTGAVPNNDWGYGKLHLGDLVDPTCAVTAPNGGETLIIGNNTNLTWTAADNVGVTQVDLHLSRAGVGGPWETLALNQPNSGSYPWTVTGPASNNAILRVTARDAATNSVQDVSDFEFAIIDLATDALLSLFEATPMQDAVSLRWRFGSSANFRGVDVERAPATTGPWSAIAAERRDEGGVTVAVDHDATAGVTFYYRLRAVSPTGQVSVFGPLAGTAGASISKFEFMPVAPNPTSGLARAEFAVPRSMNVKLEVLDLQGRVVATLANGQFRPSRYQYVWTGEIDGHQAPGGVYFMRLQSEMGDLVRRVVVAP
jgi:hypothetical protein